MQRAGNKSGVRVDVIFQATWLVQDEMQRAQVIPRPSHCIIGSSYSQILKMTLRLVLVMLMAGACCPCRRPLLPPLRDGGCSVSSGRLRLCLRG